jgi:hypothetical protein
LLFPRDCCDIEDVMKLHRSFSWLVALPLSVVLAGCGSPPEPNVPDRPEETPLEADDEPAGDAEPESVDTGKDCATAEALCEGGVCTLAMKNDCPEPVTCELKIIALCRGETEVGEARGVGRDTFAAGVTGELQAGADCQGANVAATQIDELTCQ